MTVNKTYLLPDNFPAQTSLPTLTGPTIYSGAADAFYFQCDIGYPACESDNTARFEVRFWADDDTTEDTVAVITDVNCTHPYAELNYLLLRGHLGKSVSCFKFRHKH